MTPKKIIILSIHVLVIWALCGATVGIGRAAIGIGPTLIVHVMAAPIFAALISLFYYKKFNYTTPLQTTLTFLIFVMVLDAGLVVPVFEKSFSMFQSAIGTWIPFALIFLATYITGLRLAKKSD